MFKRIHLLSGFLILASAVWGSNSPVPLSQAEDSLQRIMNLLKAENSLTRKIALNDSFSKYFYEILQNPESFDYQFDSLKNVGRIRSEDGKIRIFTWNLPITDGKHKYFGYIQVKNDSIIKLYQLADSRSEISNQQTEICKPEKWYGALYYHLEQRSFNGQTFYTLMGVDFNNIFSAKRIIEVLSINGNGEPVFGAPIFRIQDQTINRVIFEYSARAKMLLRYSPEMDMIIFDHLSPSRGDLVGNYQFYGPDFTFDGFKFEDGMWNYLPNVEVRNAVRENPVVPVTPPEVNPEPGFLYRSNLELRKDSVLMEKLQIESQKSNPTR